MSNESKFITRKEKEKKEKKSGPYITRKNTTDKETVSDAQKRGKRDLGEIMSRARDKKKYEAELEKAAAAYKKEKSGPYITRKNTTDKETVGDAQKRGKIELSKAINFKKGGRVKKRKNTRRMNRLEELGRVDAEKAFTKRGKRNLKAEKKRIVRELKSSGGSAGVALRGKGCEIR